MSAAALRNIRAVQREHGDVRSTESLGNLDEPINVLEAANALDVPLSRLMGGL